MRKQWTLMMFIAGTNDLHSGGLDTLAEIKSVGSNDTVDAVAQFDVDGKEGPRYHLHARTPLDADLVEWSSGSDFGDWKTPVAFIRWANQRNPAERRMLVFRAHGSGIGPRSLGGSGLTLDDDEFLSLKELKKALKRGRKIVGRRFDIIGFEACFMNTIEVAYQLRDFARVILASQSRIPAAGWPFQLVMRDLQENPPFEAAELSKRVVERVLHSVREKKDEFATMAALDCTKIHDVVESISPLADLLHERLGEPALVSAIDVAHREAQSFELTETIDLLDFCGQLSRQPAADSSIIGACGKIRTAVGDFVLRSESAGPDVRRARGISIFFPMRNAIPQVYRDLDFAAYCSWIRFLENYLPKVCAVSPKTIMQTIETPPFPPPPPNGNGGGNGAGLPTL